MRYLIFFCLLCLNVACKTATKAIKPQSAVTDGKVVMGNFPKGWIGTWHGTLQLYGARAFDPVPMWVDIFPLDTSREGRYKFALTYKNRDSDFRPYELVPADTAKGLWRIDEKNNIVMENYLRGPRFLGWFVVQGSRVLCMYELMDSETMSFEVVSGPENVISVTGGGTHPSEPDSIPLVSTYPISMYQRAILKKINRN